MKNWRTTAFGLATLAVYVASYFLPQHKAFLDGLVPILVAGGLLSAKDSQVTGGTIKQ